MLGSKYEVFLCVAKWGSFSRAAEELFLTQPAVTRQIKALEEELGFALFTRSRNSIRLTRAGKSLAGSLAGIRDIADKALREASDIADGKLTSIALGYATPYSTYWLPGALRRLYAIRQATNVRLFKDRSVKLVDKLVTGEIDAAVVSQADLRDTGIPSRHVCTSRPYAYVSADSPLASLEAVSLEDLRQERILAPASSASSDVIHLGIRNLMASGLSMEEFTLVDSPESGFIQAASMGGVYIGPNLELPEAVAVGLVPVPISGNLPASESIDLCIAYVDPILAPLADDLAECARAETCAVFGES
ncbi:MAG: LysR family transcriptional regulator [Eggerthellaceae bacterium]|nr:LysR family transcriptional regulator [Eggerthellaceae bacterium]